MAITIDWPTGVINVPRNDLTLVQSTPTEIREMDLNWFRLQLKALETTTYGMAYLKTHIHNTEVNLGGITYARVIEILDPYTVTFEDGQYAVNLFGANSNVGDKVNVNQVSVRSQNSAGLISSPLVEYSAFQNGVWIDPTNGVSGTVFPTGTPQQPVNNLADAKIIADYRGFKTIFVVNELHLIGSYDFSDFNFNGQSHSTNSIIVDTSVDVTNCVFTDLQVSGVFDGNSEFNNCVVNDATYINGHIHNSGLIGTIKLDGGNDGIISNCVTVDPYDPPIIDMGSTGQNLALPNYSGLLTIKNLSGTTEFVGIGMNSGEVVLDSTTVTGGIIHIAGIGTLVDENGDRILSGTWNGGVTVINSLLNTSTISEASQLGDFVYIDQTNGVSGTTFPIGTERSPVNNLDDAVLIGEDLGVSRFYFVSDFNFASDVYITDYDLYGEGVNETTLTFNAGCIVLNCHVYNATATGNLSGVAGFDNCKLIDLGSVGIVPSSQEIILKNCLFYGTTTLPSNYSGKVTLIDCYSDVPGNNTPIFDIGNSTASAQFRQWTGGMELRNATSGNTISIDVVSANVKLHDSMTSATIVARGVGKLVEASTGNHIPSGIWNGGVDVSNDIVSKGTVADAVLDTSLIGYDTENTVAHSLRTTNYANQITLDAINGVTGTTYPVGTTTTPVNNITDAYTISQQTGIDHIHIDGDYTFETGILISGVTVSGMGRQDSTFTFQSGAITANCHFEDALLTGEILGVIGFKNCHLQDFSSPGTIPSSATVIFENCLLQGTLSIPSNFTGNIICIDSWALPTNGAPPIFNMNGGDFDVQLRNFSGFLTLQNCTQLVDFRVFFISGGIRLESTVTNGEFVFTGVGTLVDNSTGSAVIDSDALISKDIIATAVWDEPIADHLIDGSTGKSVGVQQYDGKVSVNINSTYTGTTFPVGTARAPVNNIPDAILIANNNGIETINFEADHTIESTDDVSGFNIEASNEVIITVQSGAVTEDTYFFDMLIRGELNGHVHLNKCFIHPDGITEFHGYADECLFNGPITISSDTTKNAVFLDCMTGDVSGPPTINCNGDGAKLSLRGLTGAALITNKTGSTQRIFIDLYSARIGFDSTVTAGNITVRGVGYIYQDDSTNTTFDLQGLISQPTIVTAVWDQPIIEHTTEDTTGYEMLKGAYTDGFVYISDGGVTGVTYPYGTPDKPVSTIADGLIIANLYGISRLHIDGNITVEATDDISGFLLKGERSVGNSITVTSGATTHLTYMTDLTVSGVMNGAVRYTTCVLGQIDNFDGGAKNSLLTNTINITGSGANYFTDCDTYITDYTTFKEINVGDNFVNLIRCRGNYKITNKTGVNTTSIDLVAGTVEIDSTCTAGVVFLDGIVKTIDNSSAGCEVIYSNTVDPEVFADYTWEEMLSGHTTEGSAGQTLTNATTGGVDYGLLAQAVWEYVVATSPPDDQAGYLLNQINDFVDDLHKIQGLDPNNPMTVTRTNRTAGTIDLDITGDGENTTTVTRQ